MQGSVRINKFLSDAGFCSRRAADRLIEEGRVMILHNGISRTAVPGDRAEESDTVTVDGKEVHRKETHVYLAYHKPAGVVCTADLEDENNIIKAVGYPGYLTYVGRLDRESTGLILLTDDGELNNRLSKAAFYHEKEYFVVVDHPFPNEFLEHMRNGVPILDTITRPCRCARVTERSFRIILTQGLNRQIRRMCGALGYGVVSLKRIRVQNIVLGDLKEGTWRILTDKEIEILKQSCGL